MFASGVRAASRRASSAALHARCIARLAQCGESRSLRLVGFLPHAEHRDRERRLLGDKLVDADDHAPMLLDLPLLAHRALGDLPLEPPLLDATHHAALLLDLGEDRLGFALELVGERLDVVRAAERIDHVRDAGLVGEDLLRAQRDLHRFLGGERQRLVHRVGVQRLRPAEHRGHRLVGDAHDVVRRLLRGERHAGGLASGSAASTSAGPWRRSARACRLAQMRRAARSLAISSKKSLWMSKKNERRGAKASTSSPRATPRSTYVKPLARVNASSCAAVAPASRM